MIIGITLIRFQIIGLKLKKNEIKEEIHDKNKKKDKEKFYKKFMLSDEQIINIVEEKKKEKITINDDELKSKITYVYKYRSKNYIFYVCSISNKCPGKGNFNIKSNEFYVTEKCDPNIPHKKISYKEFEEILREEDIKKLDFNDKIIQKYYVYHMIKNNNNITNPELKNIFYSKFNTTLKLS